MSTQARPSLAPRVLEVDLARGAGRRWDWTSARPAVARVGSWSGSALALALLYEAALEQPDADAPLVIAVGTCVRDGVPTAARASVASRAPLTGLYSEGQVGGELGPRLGQVVDALVLRGRAAGGDVVVHVSADASVRLERRPELRGLPAAQALARLESRGSAALAIGPAGERQVSIACLMAAGAPPHVVGRGGLGAVLGRMGVKAVVVEAALAPPKGKAGLVQALLRSPRLEARAQGGTLELFAAVAAEGDLGAEGRDLAKAAEDARAERHGCTGCPTPCGWTFHRPGASPQGARFGAASALGPQLGLLRLEDALELLAACDREGLDAKEAAAGLELLCIARESGLLPGGPARGQRELLLRWIVELAAGAGEGGLVSAGAHAFAARHGLLARLHHAKGATVRPGSNLAAMLGQCVSSRGADPMRTFPFLADAGGQQRLARLLAPLAAPTAGEDARASAEAGRLVWWHENLAAALDAGGFCAFSAAALLADGVCGLDELWAWIAPPSGADVRRAEGAPRGWELLAMGEALVALQRRLNELWGIQPGADQPEWCRARLAPLWEEYRALRGLDSDGRLTPEAWRRFESGLPGEIPPKLRARDLAPDPLIGGSTTEPAGAPSVERALGSVVVRASGTLGRALGERIVLRLELPATLERVQAALGSKAAGPEPSVFRAGRRMLPGDWVQDGDVLDLVLVVSGG